MCNICVTSFSTNKLRCYAKRNKTKVTYCLFPIAYSLCLLVIIRGP